MADTEQAVEVPEVEHDVEDDVPEVEHEGGELGDEEAPASTACDNLPGVAADTPSGGQPVIAKLLISNAAAGSVIGKGGQTIEQIQKNSGARVQLSRAGEFYPGTSERVLLLSGTLHSVLTSVFLMLEKLPKEPVMAMGRAAGKPREDAHAQVKMAVSRKLCGAVIGQKGATIRDFMADSGAVIRVQPLSELTPSDSERLISVSGGRDKVLRAVALILNTLSADDKFGSYMDLTLQLANTQGLIPAVRTSTARSVLAGAKATLLMALQDEDVGAVLGKKGQTLTQIQQNAKVTIKISDRNKMDPLTHEREVAISGSYAAIQLAAAMISEKLSQNKPRMSYASDGHDDEMDENGHHGGHHGHHGYM
ncbi:hypothetical protein OEZ85_003158 [Tetradesmus obliquus]|uniref:K Homology domain-containing protein n=1 Tax=Tetradesmus obliquus TaxID=3088 RepID=A0ABY8U3W6_TETOB|nr:hypothetical protein OEZ85_003158 [Tetradesmus obliquus]